MAETNLIILQFSPSSGNNCCFLVLPAENTFQSLQRHPTQQKLWGRKTVENPNILPLRGVLTLPGQSKSS